jgi:hypothetical protein
MLWVIFPYFSGLFHIGPKMPERTWDIEKSRDPKRGLSKPFDKLECPDGFYYCKLQYPQIISDGSFCFDMSFCKYCRYSVVLVRILHDSVRLQISWRQLFFVPFPTLSNWFSVHPWPLGTLGTCEANAWRFGHSSQWVGGGLVCLGRWRQLPHDQGQLCNVDSPVNKMSHLANHRFLLQILLVQMANFFLVSQACFPVWIVGLNQKLFSQYIVILPIFCLSWGFFVQRLLTGELSHMCTQEFTTGIRRMRGQAKAKEWQSKSKCTTYGFFMKDRVPSSFTLYHHVPKKLLSDI